MGEVTWKDFLGEFWEEVDRALSVADEFYGRAEGRIAEQTSLVEMIEKGMERTATYQESLRWFLNHNEKLDEMYEELEEREVE